ncbi:MAG: ABC transporter substrate-binding protein [Chloroflexia bacterium]|nr:ABC transporter substrate-binding protein [Chloroflexia bacterium]
MTGRDTFRSYSLTRRSLLGKAGVALAGAGVLGAGAPATVQSVFAAALQQDGGTLTVGTVGDFLNLDPFVLTFVNYPVMENIYDQLVRLDQETNPQPWLAESWALSDDFLTLTLNLRKGVTFHSGRELVAADVVANFERARVQETGGNLYANMAAISTVTAIDSSTVEIKFTQPAAYIYSALGLISIIEPEKFENLASEAAGTGAFSVKEWIPGDHATFIKNAAYWDTDRPLVDEITIQIYGDEGSLVSALEGGILDIAVGIPAREMDRLAQSFTIVKGQPGARFYYLGMSPKLAPFDNKLVRQAMAHAIDRQTLVDNVLFGAGIPIATPFPESSPAYFPEHAEMYPYDLDKAKELLTQAGFADGFTFTIPTPSGFPEIGQFAQIFQADLATIGCTLNIEPMDNAQWYPILREGTYEAIFSFAGGPQLYPTRIALSANFAAVDNTAWPEGNPPAAYAEGLQAADATFDPEQQKVALKQMTDSFMDEAWNVAVSFKSDLFALTNQITGFDFGVYSQPRFDNVSKNG